MSILSVMTRTTHQTRAEGESESTKTRPTPIQLQTENGFSIVRRCDLDEKTSTYGPEHCFVVRDPYGYELDITVDFSEAAISEVSRRSCGRITHESSFWINCAERHLSDYLWENDDYPPDGKITIYYLTPDDVDSARRWGTEVPQISKLTSGVKFPVTRSLDGDVDGLKAKAKTEPIKVVTENGYSIERLCELDESFTDSPDECHFRITNPKGLQREIIIGFDPKLVAEIQSRRRRGRLVSASKYWPVIAEKFLADYVWQKNDFPPTDKLTIDQLDGDDLLLGAHWKEPQEG